MKYYYSFYLIFLLSFTSVDESKKMRWSADRKLTWSDYLAVPDMKSESSAVTTTSVSCFPLSTKGDTVTYRIEALMYKGESWTMFSDTSTNGLMHEQTHFDITELYARKLRKEAALIKATRGSELNIEFEKKFRANQDSLHAYQDKYDNETGFSGRKLVQKQWSQKIEMQLKDSDSFSGIFVKILMVK
ncbi:MAG: hypothetical protein IAF38_04345 [Bacteroidia bacterium]|nr:hypothetical protein [Bacteroidia bacterium]